MALTHPQNSGTKPEDRIEVMEDGRIIFHFHDADNRLPIVLPYTVSEILSSPLGVPIYRNRVRVIRHGKDRFRSKTAIYVYFPPMSRLWVFPQENLYQAMRRASS